jgi:hypothetical protein
MRLPLVLGYILVILMVAALLSAVWVVDLLPLSSAAEEAAGLAAEWTLGLSYLGLWIWMLCDHLFSTEREYAALISIFLIVGGGLAGIAYFFLVFRPRELARAPVVGWGPD